MDDKAKAYQCFTRCTCNPASVGFGWQEKDIFLSGLRSTAERQNPRPLGRGTSILVSLFLIFEIRYPQSLLYSF
jgi:hypothetical protein